MKYCMYYWLFEPIREMLEDSASRPVEFEIPINFEQKEYKIALACDVKGIPEFCRLRIPGLCEAKIPDAVLPLMQSAKEHLLSIIRLLYRQDSSFFPISIWSFFDEGKEHSFSMEIRANLHEPFNADTVQNAFAASFEYRNDVRLVVDGLDDRLPAQFRYLSFYKLIEKHFKKGDHWKNEDLKKFVDKHQSDFTSAGFTKDPIRLLHELRDKCAHIRTGSKKEIMGVTHLNHEQLVRVEKALPIMRVLCVAILNKIGKGKFEVGDLTPWYERGNWSSVKGRSAKET